MCATPNDTDSIYTTETLPDKLVGDDLGLMKDELKGLTIREAYFLGIKQYGYWYIDEKGNRIEKSTFAGVPKNALSFTEIIELSKGKTITKTKEDVFYHYLQNLEISIKPRTLNLAVNPQKLLQDNTSA